MKPGFENAKKPESDLQTKLNILEALLFTDIMKATERGEIYLAMRKIVDAYLNEVRKLEKTKNLGEDKINAHTKKITDYALTAQSTHSKVAQKQPTAHSAYNEPLSITSLADQIVKIAKLSTNMAKEQPKKPSSNL